jgi:hypothetical protein
MKKNIMALKASSILLAVFFICLLAGCGEKTYESDDDFSVTFSIRADILLANMQMLDGDKHELIPADGIILPAKQAAAYEGDSVFDILQRETRNAQMHMAARFTPIINEAYVEAINNIYAYDAGPLSGWKFSVNGVFPDISASSFIVNPGDTVIWAYTLDLGRDLGAGGEW